MLIYESKPVVLGDFKARYKELCDLRDAVNDQNKPLEVELTEVNSQIETLRQRQMQIAHRIDENRGFRNWSALKRDIGLLAQALSGRHGV